MAEGCQFRLRLLAAYLVVLIVCAYSVIHFGRGRSDQTEPIPSDTEPRAASMAVPASPATAEPSPHQQAVSLDIRSDVAEASAPRDQLGASGLQSDTLRWIHEGHAAGRPTSKPCEQQFGLPFILSWRGKAQPLCEAQATHPTSRVTAYPISFPQHFFPDRRRRSLTRTKDERIIAMESFDAVMDSRQFTAEMEQGGDPKPKPGSIKVCSPPSASAMPVA